MELQQVITELQAIKDKHEPPTLPEIFGIEYKEIYITKWLAYLLAADVIGIDILNALLFIYGQSGKIDYTEKPVVKSEYPFNSHRRIDIIIFTNDYLIGIENKLLDKDSSHTSDYSKCMDKIADKRKTVKIYLRPEFNNSKSTAFVNITYTQLLNEINDIQYPSGSVDPNANMLFTEFKKYVKECLCVKYPEFSPKARLYHEYEDVILSAQNEYDDARQKMIYWIKAAFEKKGFTGAPKVESQIKNNYWQLFRGELNKIGFHFELRWEREQLNEGLITVEAHLELESAELNENDKNAICREFGIKRGKGEPNDPLESQTVSCDFSTETSAHRTIEKITKVLESPHFERWAQKADEYMKNH